VQTSLNLPPTAASSAKQTSATDSTKARFGEQATNFNFGCSYVKECRSYDFEESARLLLENEVQRAIRAMVFQHALDEIFISVIYF